MSETNKNEPRGPAGTDFPGVSPGHPEIKPTAHPDLAPKAKPAKKPEVPMPPGVMRSGGERR